MKKYNLNQNVQRILTFKKWKRKNYSLFLMMKRTVNISVLSVTYLVSVPANSVAAAQDTIEIKMEYDLDEIQVNAQRAPAVYSQVARIVSVMEREEIQAAPAQSVQELLEYVAGVDVRQRGSAGVQADVSIRGGTFDQTLILLNGINITDPQTGHHNLNLPVSLSQIERIEVLEGPAARIYGPNAFSGAINIVTHQAGSKAVQASIVGGSYAYFDANLSGGFKTGKLLHSLALSRNSSDGYIDNTDFTISNLFYSNQLVLSSGELHYQIGFANKGFGANSFYTPKYPKQYEQTKTLFSSVKWQSKGKLHFSPAIYWRRHQDRFELFRDNPPSWYKTHNYHLTNTFGGNLNWWGQWKLGKTAFGVEWRSENILSNVLGESLDSPKPVPGEDAEFTKSGSRNTVSGFFEHAYYYNKWIFTGGIMANLFSDSNLGLNVFPGVDVSYNFTSNLKAFSSFNTALRMPTFTDLYYSGPTNIGNPDLKPEQSATLEGGFKLNSRGLQGYIVGFHRKGRNIIDWAMMESGGIWQPQNLTKLNAYGTEIEIALNLKSMLGNHFPNKLRLNYLFNHVGKENQGFISNYALDNLKHKFVASVNQNLLKGLVLDLKVLFQDREGTFTTFENGDYGRETEYPPFWLFDGKLAFQEKKITAFVSINNVFDIHYNDIGNVAQPGRWIRAGIAYQLHFE